MESIKLNLEKTKCNTNTYIATFFSHFGAIRFKKIYEKEFLEMIIMPVPRDLSSSCGTCVKFKKEYLCCDNLKHNDEIEQIVQLIDKKYKTIYKAENI